MELALLPKRPSDWNSRIAPFDTKTLFHESEWLDFVLRRHPGHSINYYEIASGGRCLGYFCAILKRRVTVLLCESPDAGRGVHIGPVVNHDIDPSELISAVLRMCRRSRIASIELSMPSARETMHDFGFTRAMNTTQVCSLTGGSEGAWARMHKTRRTSLRKAEKDGLVAEATGDPAIIEYFMRAYSQALARKRLTPTYSAEQARAILECLLPADRIFPVWVKRDGHVVGAAFYPHDDRTMYFWDGASEPDALRSYPNDLLHWTAIKLAAERGIRAFHMASGPAPQPFNRFARNFGCEEQQFTLYQTTLLPFLAPMRKTYRWLNTARTQYQRRSGVMRAIALCAVLADSL